EQPARATKDSAELRIHVPVEINCPRATRLQAREQATARVQHGNGLRQGIHGTPPRGSSKSLGRSSMFILGLDCNLDLDPEARLPVIFTTRWALSLRNRWQGPAPGCGRW